MCARIHRLNSRRIICFLALHTMAILQAYQTDVLKELRGTGLTPEAVKELHRATDLALRATKHTARAVGRLMAGLVAAERHFVAKPQRRAVSPLWGEVRPQKRFCPLQTCSPHSKPSQPPLGAWRAGRVHPHLFSVWQLGDALSFPRYSPSFRRRRAACVGTQSILPCSVRTPCWPPVSPALHTPSTRTRTPRALLRGGGCRCSRFGLATHFSLGNMPRLDGVQLTVVNSAFKASVLQL